MVFVNGQKAEISVSPANQLQYEETDLTRVTFGAGLDDADVVEFIVLGTYNIIDTTQLFMPPGFVFPIVNSNTPPAGTLACEGSFVSKTTYANLLSGYPLSIGTYYGDGGATFALPDFRGRVPRGWDNGAGRDPDTGSRYADSGGPTGNNVGSMQNEQVINHGHTITVGGFNLQGVGEIIGGGTPRLMAEFGPPLGTPATIGGAGGNETRMDNFNVMWCIKY